MSTPYHHGDLRRQLVDVTRVLVERDGPDAVTIARVAKECGVSVAAPYRHFDDKGALLGEVASTGFTDLADALVAAATAAGTARERLVETGVAYVSFAQGHPHLFRLMFTSHLRTPQTTTGPAALGVLATAVGALAEESGLAVGPDTALRTLWALAHGLATLRIGDMRTFTQDDSPERLRGELAVLLDGIIPDGDRPEA